MKRDKDSLSTWVLGSILVDLVLGLIFLGLLQGFSHPAFGPPLWLKAWAGAYEDWHRPLGYWVDEAQYYAGFLGTFSQAWHAPMAQVVRLIVFAANSALLGLGLHFVMGKKAAHILEFRAAHAAHLRQLVVEDGAWSPLPARAEDHLHWRTSLRELESLVAQSDPDLVALQRARAYVLAFLWVGGQDARPWLALGQASLRLAEAASEKVDADGLAFANACLRRARVLEPENPELWRTFFRWRLLPLENLADAPPKVLEGLGPEGAIWALAHDPALQGEGLPLAVAQWDSRWPDEVESLRLRAEAQETLDRGSEALELWRTLMMKAPSDWRWRRSAMALARSYGLPEKDWRLTAPGPALTLPSDWIYQTWRPSKLHPGLLKLGRILTSIALLYWMVEPIHTFKNAGPGEVWEASWGRAIWPGRWYCTGIVSPTGPSFETWDLPPTYRSYLPEDANSYSAMVALADSASFFIGEKGSEELYLDRAYPMTWDKGPWGLAMHAEGFAGGTIHVRGGGAGVVMSVPGKTWLLLFSSEAMIGKKRSPNLVFRPQEVALPAIRETWRGNYIGTRDFGWQWLGSGGESFPVFEGVISDPGSLGALRGNTPL